MKEALILFSAPMVRAILSGAKSQTRRLITPHNSHFGSAPRLYWQHADFSRAWKDGSSQSVEYLHVPCHVEDRGTCAVCDERDWPGTSHRLYPNVWSKAACADQEDECPPSRLWVKETWAAGKCADSLKPSDLWPPFWLRDNGGLWYPADNTEPRHPVTPRGKTRVSIFLPRWASRVILDATAVRAQRLQEITEEDAKAEGAEPWKFGPSQRLTSGELGNLHRGGFAVLWDSINADRATWFSNPWIWAITFERITDHG